MSLSAFVSLYIMIWSLTSARYLVSGFDLDMEIILKWVPIQGCSAWKIRGVMVLDDKQKLGFQVQGEYAQIGEAFDLNFPVWSQDNLIY